MEEQQSIKLALKLKQLELNVNILEETSSAASCLRFFVIHSFYSIVIGVSF